jgi:transcriptional regulator PpsR
VLANLVKGFAAPRRSLGNLDAASAAGLIAASSDLVLILDKNGIVRDVAGAQDELLDSLALTGWIGKPWLETVTEESRAKIAGLLRDAASAGTPNWRQVNHSVGPDVDLPILYCAVPIGRAGRIAVFGRDLRPMSTLQQRFIDAQQSVERDYLRLRRAETRYRLLFQMSSEAILGVEAGSLKVLEANPEALMLLGGSEKRVLGRPLTAAFAPDTAPSLHALLATVRAAGRADPTQLRLSHNHREVFVSAFFFRQNESPLFFVQMRPLVGTTSLNTISESNVTLLDVMKHSPDAIVVTAADGRILAVNAAFLEMTQLPGEEQALGEPLDRWLGRPGADVNLMSAMLRQHGSLRLFGTSLQDGYGASSQVEVSAVSVARPEGRSFGFAIRNVDRRMSGTTRQIADLPRSVDQLTELIGRVSLRDLVRETTDLIERLCIEAALGLTGDNRASAAEMLGLSRQSLYMKLHRYGLADRDDQGTDADQ